MDSPIAPAFFSVAVALALSNCVALKAPASEADPKPSAVNTAFAQTFSESKAYQNSLGMRFVPVQGTNALFSIWDTRVQDYAEFVSSTDRSWPKPQFHQTPTDPAVNVSLEDAHAFCAWLTHKEIHDGKIGAHDEYRLPTDAEWSVAVGLGAEDGTTPEDKNRQIKGVYPWGRDWPPPRGAGNYADSSLHKAQEIWGQIENYDDGFPFTSPVGSFAPNRFGLYDMGGNVTQWCEDFYNMNGPSRVKRGGYLYLTLSDDALSSARFPADAGECGDAGGFRCVLEHISESENQDHAHALAFGAILDSLQKNPLTQLRWKDSPDTARQALALGGVHSRLEFLQVLRRFENGTDGQRNAYWAFLRQNGAPRLEGTAGLPIAAWDFGHYISLCRCGYNAEYLTETEAWDKILAVARLLQRSYSSWEDFSADYMRGLAFTSPKDMVNGSEQFRDILTELSEAPDGLWATIPWTQSLGDGPIAIDRLAETIRRAQLPADQGQPTRSSARLQASY
jgi:hypothetical protein